MANEKRLIDANALMDDVEMDGALYACLGAVDDVRFLVDSQPTVDAVEVVHGKWINDAVEGFSPFADSPIWIDVMQCSVCKGYIDGSHPKNYCPNCGAKMDGDGNGNTQD